NRLKDETERIQTNPYLSKKVEQGRKDMKKGEGLKIAIEDTWK
ncbi:MAG: hypothetical protein JWQ84_2193, partial [Mucilaginibacter sp.]|nr:hypothetical protein [Mucilaginibacter sp.]